MAGAEHVLVDRVQARCPVHSISRTSHDIPMMMPHKSYTFRAGPWLFIQFIDRYATDTYGPSVKLIEAIDRAGQVENLEAFDLFRG